MFDYTYLLDKRFKYGGRGPDVFDCYGLAIEIYKVHGIDLPDFGLIIQSHEIHTQVESAKSLFIPTEKPTFLSIAAFQIIPRYITHIGVMLDRKRFIHIMRDTKVSVENIHSLEWKCKIRGFFNYNS